MTDQTIENENVMTNINFAPTLYVFLGSSPAQIGWRLKELQDQAYGDLGIYQYLWIDTDERTDPDLDNWLKSENVNRTIIGDYHPSEVLRNLDGYPSIKAWWPTFAKIGMSSVLKGAQQKRLLGRLSLFALFSQVRGGQLAINDSLKAAATRVAGIAQAQAVNQMTKGNLSYSVSSNDVRVYIINSMCGGTGSGIVFDVAYLLREYFSDNHIKASMMAVQILPSVIERAIGTRDPNQREKIKTNAYGYLQDLDYLMETQDWKVDYPGGKKADQSFAPFDYYYVVDIANREGRFLRTPLEVYKMTSQALFLMSISPISGTHFGELVNAAVYERSFRGKIPYVNSFAAASLVYPKDRIMTYCAHRLTKDLIDHLNVNVYSESDERPRHLALIEELSLDPKSLFALIKDNQSVINDRLELIKDAKDPGEAFSYIVNELGNDDAERNALYENFKKTREALTERLSAELSRKIAVINAEFGPQYALGVIRGFLRDRSLKNSLTGYISAIDNDSTITDDVGLFNQKLEEIKATMTKMSKDFVQSAFKFFLKNEWRDRFETTKAEAINAMADMNAACLRERISMEMKNIYVQVAQEAKKISDVLEGFSRQLIEVSSEINRQVDLLLQPKDLGHIFELSQEVIDSQYFIDYYERQRDTINLIKVYQEFMEAQVGNSIELLKTYENKGLKSSLIKVSGSKFRSQLDDVSLLSEMKRHYGDQFDQVLTEKIENVVDYCLPFWRFRQVDENLQVMSPGYIGVEDANSANLPNIFQNRADFTLVSTGIKDAIYFARAEHGVALWMLTELNVWKRAYENYMRTSAGTDPINIIPKASRQELDPDSSKESSVMFALGLAFGFITQRGAFYYFDEMRKYGDKKVKPNKSDRIAQGREKAESEFVANYQWVNRIRELVTNEIGSIGNKQAEKYINKYLEKLKKQRDLLGEEDSIRGQLDREIDNLKKFVKGLA